MIDSHCHLSHAFSAENLVSGAKNALDSLSCLIDISTTESEYLNIKSLELPQSILYAYGLYPDQAASATPAALRRFEEVLDLYPPAAIGECGIDFHWDYGGIDGQERLFRAQIETACARGLPLVVHSRDAFDDTYRILKDAKPSIPVVIHCFGYGRAEAEAFLGLGFVISFAGNLTYKNARGLHEAASVVRLTESFRDGLALLTPVPHRGKPNRPEYVEHVYRYFRSFAASRWKRSNASRRNFRAVSGVNHCHKWK
jgi:TatD DNase family protein